MLGLLGMEFLLSPKAGRRLKEKWSAPLYSAWCTTSRTNANHRVSLAAHRAQSLIFSLSKNGQTLTIFEGLSPSLISEILAPKNFFLNNFRAFEWISRRVLKVGTVLPPLLIEGKISGT